MEFLLAVVSCPGETQCVGNVHNVSNTRVSEFDSTQRTSIVDVKLVLTHFDFNLNASFITLCPKCDISM